MLAGLSLLLLTHQDGAMRERAAQAARALVSPPQAFLPLFSGTGEGWVALQATSPWSRP